MPGAQRRADAAQDDAELAAMLALHAQDRQKPHKGYKGRDSFIAPSVSPGPAAYQQDVAILKPSAHRTVIGTSRRENEAHRYISSLHNAAVPPGDTPGPGTYRTHMDGKYPRSPKKTNAPTFKFGTAPQRTDDFKSEAAKIPGPIYHLPSEITNIGYTFAPQGNFDMGVTRTRTDASKVFISNAHAAIDKSGTWDATAEVGPGQYDAVSPDATSPKRKAPAIGFPRSSRDVRDSLTQQQLSVEPLATTAANTPAAHYDVAGSTLNKTATKFGSGPRTYSPEKGASAAGPYLSRLHESTMQGTASPGPGAYTIPAGAQGKPVPGIGDGPTYTFGTSPQTSPMRGMRVPGPGAYMPKIDALSRANSAPAFSLGANIRTEFVPAAIKENPGPGSYDVALAAPNEAGKTNHPAYSMGVTGPVGRSSFVPPTIGPGPAAYGLKGAIDNGPGRGYSFGAKEKTIHEKSTVSVRYHGPLAAQEALGTQSPGPGLYDVRASAERTSQGHRVPDVHFGTADRGKGRKIYISRQHAEADGAGVDSPGPGAYNQNTVELADVTSKYRKPAAAVFSSSSRFNMNYLTF